MLKQVCILAAALAGIFAGGPALAQAAPSPSSPYTRPLGMESHDTATEPSERDRLINGIRADNVDRSARMAREGAAYARPAGPAELVTGAVVNDYHGKRIATVEGVDREGAVLFNGTARVKVPLDAFGRNRRGLMLDLTKDEFDRMVARANAGGD